MINYLDTKEPCILIRHAAKLDGLPAYLLAHDDDDAIKWGGRSENLARLTVRDARFMLELRELTGAVLVHEEHVFPTNDPHFVIGTPSPVSGVDYFSVLDSSSWAIEPHHGVRFTYAQVFQWLARRAEEQADRGPWCPAIPVTVYDYRELDRDD